MEGAYTPEDVIVKLVQTDRKTGEVVKEIEVTGFAEAEELSEVDLLARLYGVVRKPDESDEELIERLLEVKKGIL